MCGIAGVLHLQGDGPGRPEVVNAMLDRLVHRGPDDHGDFRDGPVVLGHRRLSVIDPAGGRQPLTGQRPSTVVVCNGEIYNYRELATELRGLGHRFRTASDTEVLAHAYDRWGLDFIDRLEGMFAFVLWDGERRRLVLARDRFGEKPLYWARRDDELIFASELTALLAHGGIERTLDRRSLSAYLALEYVPAPRTLIRDVSKLEAATMLVIENGSIDARRYWELPTTPMEPHSFAEAVERLRDLLDASVRRQLVSDVPLGIFLSGGIDSSTVAALAARAGELETFAIGFREASFDESKYARMVARHIGSHHHERILSAAAVADELPELLDCLDEPIGDASILPTAILSRFARERVTVALGGDGGDELFAGYPMHQAHRVAGIFNALPGALNGGLRSLNSRLPVRHGNFTLRFKIETFLRGVGHPPPWNHARWMASFTPEEQQALLPDDDGTNAFAAIGDAWDRSGGAPPLARACHLDALTYLPNDILTKVDRASMAASLEVRAPFLSRDLAEFAFRLPDAYRMKSLTGKRLLRSAVRPWLPKAVVDRPKKGFGMPVGAWLRGALRELAQDTLGDGDGAEEVGFDRRVLQRLLREHDQGVQDHRKPLWTLLSFELWRRRIAVDRGTAGG